MKTHRRMQGGYHVKTEADTEVMCLQTKEWQGMLETTRKEWLKEGHGTGKEGHLPQSPQKELTLLTRSFQNPVLQNWGTINSCCWKPPSLWQNEVKDVCNVCTSWLGQKKPVLPASLIPNILCWYPRLSHWGSLPDLHGISWLSCTPLLVREGGVGLLSPKPGVFQLKDSMQSWAANQFNVLLMNFFPEKEMIQPLHLPLFSLH